MSMLTSSSRRFHRTLDFSHLQRRSSPATVRHRVQVVNPDLRDRKEKQARSRN
jgi:hypothetical protein